MGRPKRRGLGDLLHRSHLMSLGSPNTGRSICPFLPPLRPYRKVPNMQVLKKVRQFLVNEDGPTAVEYAVMLALILVACITIVTSLGTSASTTFSKVNSSLGS